MSAVIPVLDLAGTPYEIGLAHGKAMKERIVDFVASVTAVHQEYNSFIRVDHDSLTTFCMKNLGFLQKYSMELVEEMRGIDRKSVV